MQDFGNVQQCMWAGVVMMAVSTVESGWLFMAPRKVSRPFLLTQLKGDNPRGSRSLGLAAGICGIRAFHKRWPSVAFITFPCDAVDMPPVLPTGCKAFNIKHKSSHEYARCLQNGSKLPDVSCRVFTRFSGRLVACSVEPKLYIDM